MVVLDQQIKYSEEDLKTEIWLPCVGYEDKYLVSNFGRVRSVPYVHTRIKKNGEVYQAHYSSRIKKQCESGKRPNSKQGYLCTRLKGKDGVSVAKYVHILVAQTFIPNPNDLPTVNHKDGNKHNNKVENLEWASYSENNQHAMDNNLKTDTQTIIRVKDNYIIDIFVSISNANLQTGYSCYTIRRFLDEHIMDDYGCYWYRFEPNKYRCFKIKR